MGLKACLLLMMALLSSVSWAAEPQTPEEARAQIEALKDDLKELNGWLEDLKDERSSVEQQLEGKEQVIQDLSKRILELQQSLKQGAAQLEDLQVQQRDLQRSIQQQNAQIAAQLRAVYRSGSEEGLQYLLNDLPADESMRLIHYNRYFSNARQSLINGYAAQASELNLVEKSIRSQRAQMIQEQEELTKQQRRVEQEQAQRKKLLAKIETDLSSGDRKAQQLQKDQAQMQALLKQLEKALADVRIPDQDTPFAAQKGKLIPPLSKIRELSTNAQVNLGGVTLAADTGDAVRAVHHGRVVFADWMRGFGFLIILDHGGGYMSLYGYNQSLLKDVGEWVNANDTIATAGSSGGRAIPALFFAIRHNGEPIAALRWLSKS
ncbi:murein hydrolase activator EnvC family protein [Marinomonas ostreistagni]|uniref:murein hydrolase activator EnvC family protein n=1 Tax=Marinomonas ostreistagni TaxID=359209 RepID=UPI001951C9FE|nr:peptidoglycan DD-metalloendopeptidase family protein [Marinomonas ostreistagni]MBM6552262.1 peptidoglycan DD-metalloendopeptidase family protein [Marinomonas ostreistagni]